MKNTDLPKSIIQFIKTQVVKIDFEIEGEVGKEDISDEFNVDLKFTPIPLEKLENDEFKQFGIHFEITLIDLSDKPLMKIVMLAIFKSDNLANKEFLQSDFATVNAPAIAFPYIRAFISTLTLNAGYKPIVLPAFNFAAAKVHESASQPK